MLDLLDLLVEKLDPCWMWFYWNHAFLFWKLFYLKSALNKHYGTREVSYFNIKTNQSVYSMSVYSLSVYSMSTKLNVSMLYVIMLNAVVPFFSIKVFMNKWNQWPCFLRAQLKANNIYRFWAQVFIWNLAIYLYTEWRFLKWHWTYRHFTYSIN